MSEQPVAPLQKNFITLFEIECELLPPTKSIQRQERSGQVPVPANFDTGEKSQRHPSYHSCRIETCLEDDAGI